MKSKEPGLHGAASARRQPIGDLRMEWMDPLSWRLPSGKALAEFALQAGFLAPLMLVGPRFKKPKKVGGDPRSWGWWRSGRRRCRAVPAAFGKQALGKPNERPSVDRGSGGAGGDDQ